MFVPNKKIGIFASSKITLLIVIRRLLLFLLSTFCVFLTVTVANAQGFISGSFQSNTNFFIRDPAIGAAGLPHYDNLKVGDDAWLNVNYNNEKLGLEAGVRLDVFLNSIIKNPTVPFTGVGLGNFYVKKKVKDLTISGGYLYDQIGTGLIFRAYEERTLGIDNALLGARLEYDILKKVKLKAFCGVQKNQFTIYKPIISGFHAEGNFNIKEKVQLNPGFGVLNRSMDQGSINSLVTRIEALDTSLRFVPKYNVYAFTVYNTLSVGGFRWYIEGAFKTQDAIYGYGNKLLNTSGNIVYTSLSYSQKGFGITAQFKRTENFTMRTSANENLFNGILNFQPPVPNQNSLRLPSRYFAPALDQHELAFGADITYSPNKKWTFILNGSHVRDFIFKEALVKEQIITPKSGGGADTTYKDHKHFFSEAALHIRFKPNRSMDLEGGFQFIRYNRVIYRGDGEYAVDAYSPFIEFTHKVTRKMSYRIEAQYQYVPKDFGQWAYALLEFNIAPRWSFAVSDMWNFAPNKTNPESIYRTQHHFYSVFAAFTYHSHRFSLNYVKQVGGIVCTGGVCRFEPAFSGVKFAVTSTF